MKFKVSIIGDMYKDVRKFDDNLATATTLSLKEGGTDLKNDLRNQIEQAGLGKRLSNTWRMVMYPEGGKASKDAAAVIFSKAPHIIVGFDKGGVIRARNKRFLAIPTEFAPQFVGSGKNRRQLTPENFTKITGIELYFVPRRGKNPLLVARGVRVSSTGAIRGLRARTTKSGGERVSLAGRAEVPMFVLVPAVRLKNKLNVASAFRRHGGKVPQLIDARLGS